MLPESPRYLLLKNRQADARVSLGRLMSTSADSPEVEAEAVEIATALAVEEEASKGNGYLACFKNNEDRNGLRTWTGILMQGVCFHIIFLIVFLTDLFGGTVATTHWYQFHLYVFWASSLEMPSHFGPFHTVYYGTVCHVSVLTSNVFFDMASNRLSSNKLESRTRSPSRPYFCRLSIIYY